MADEHTKGAISTAKGDIKEGIGKLTGDRKLESKGKAQHLQGTAQDSLGDVQDAIRRPAAER